MKIDKRIKKESPETEPNVYGIYYVIKIALQVSVERQILTMNNVGLIGGKKKKLDFYFALFQTNSRWNYIPVKNDTIRFSISKIFVQSYKKDWEENVIEFFSKSE